MLGVYSRGMNLANEDSNLAFDKMKDMLAQWSIDGATVPLFTKDAITLTAGAYEFSVGPTSDIAITMPTSVASIVLTASKARLLSMSFAQWVQSHNVESGIPSGFFYQANVTGELKLNRPSASSLAATMWSHKPHTSIADLDDDMLLSFDEADIPAIMFNLAIDCAPDFDQTATPEVISRAEDYKTNLEIRRSQPMTAQSSLTSGGISLEDY